MKATVLEIFKDVITTILVLACIIFILAICFYDKISLSKVVPQSEEYNLTNSMQQELKNNELEDAKEVIVSYYLDSKDLNKYEKNNEYDKGKGNPFSAASITSSVQNNTNTSNTTNSDSGKFYPDDGTK